MKKPTVGDPIELSARQQTEIHKLAESPARIFLITVYPMHHPATLGEQGLLHQVRRLAAKIPFPEKKENPDILSP